MTEKPNILFILADDLGWGDVGYHGSPIETPNIDRLAAEGVELDRHYVCPMCTPTRVSFLTAQYPGRFGKHATVPSNAPVLPDGFKTIASYLRDSGYDTGLFGKWHLGSQIDVCANQYGFNHSYGSLAGGVHPWIHKYKKGDDSTTWQRNGELISEKGHVTDLLTQETVNWIETRTTPWFAYVPYTAVHIPVDAPHGWLDKYANQKFDGDPLKDNSYKRYAAYTSHMDHCIGELIDSLKRMDQYGNTIVIFASDNGAIHGMPLHGSDDYPGWQFHTPRLGSNGELRGQKATLYEGGIRTPAVISWPEKLKASKCTTPINMVDWLPTLCHVTDSMPAEHPLLDGINVWDQIEHNQPSNPDRHMYINFRGKEYGVISGDYKLKIGEPLRGKKEVTELFDLSTDPTETTDLSKEKPEIVEKLLRLISEEQKLDDRHKRKDAL